MRTEQKLEKLVSNRTDSSVSVDENSKVEAAGRGPFLFPTYLGRSKGLCSQGNVDYNDYKIKVQVTVFNGYFNNSLHPKERYIATIKIKVIIIHVILSGVLIGL